MRMYSDASRVYIIKGGTKRTRVSGERKGRVVWGSGGGVVLGRMGWGTRWAWFARGVGKGEWVTGRVEIFVKGVVGVGKA